MSAVDWGNDFVGSGVLAVIRDRRNTDWGRFRDVGSVRSVGVAMCSGRSDIGGLRNETSVRGDAIRSIACLIDGRTFGDICGVLVGSFTDGVDVGLRLDGRGSAATCVDVACHCEKKEDDGVRFHGDRMQNEWIC
jgi:hypothetical protein